MPTRYRFYRPLRWKVWVLWGASAPVGASALATGRKVGSTYSTTGRVTPSPTRLLVCMTNAMIITLTSSCPSSPRMNSPEFQDGNNRAYKDRFPKKMTL